jgi:hypothetical protein
MKLGGRIAASAVAVPALGGAGFGTTAVAIHLASPSSPGSAAAAADLLAGTRSARNNEDRVQLGSRSR